MRKEPQDRPKVRGTPQRRLRWLARQLSLRVPLTEQQLELVRRWNVPVPDGQGTREFRRDRRALVPEFFARGALWLLLGLLLLIALSAWLRAHGV